MNQYIKASIWDDASKFDLLLELHAKKTLSSREIGAQIGVSRNAVIGKISRLGLSNKTGPRKSPLHPCFVKPWSDEEIDKLRELWNKNVSTLAISVEIKRTEKAVKNKAQKIGLGVRKIVRVITAPRSKPVYVVSKPVECDVICNPVTLTDRTGCCFPTNNGGPFLFCNNAGKQHGASIYCDGHWQFMHVQRGDNHHGHGVKSAHRARRI